jgi:hypothetical protein
MESHEQERWCGAFLQGGLATGKKAIREGNKPRKQKNKASFPS